MIAQLNRAVWPLALALGLAACDGGTDRPAVTKNAEGVEITLTDVQTASSVGPMGLVPTAPAGATYVHVTYSLKNVSPDALSFAKWPQPLLIDARGHELQPDVFASTALSAEANPAWGENINPNLSTEGQLVWKVDKKAFDHATWKLRFLSKPVVEFELK